ncbi:hypothetical protein HanXRQr2_Chr06g0251751 [Helianthus annuus]|uniref:Uncharacterized protein n=1 Tax=Helianthus annuus TaxID=4232 RepID=A0A9K3NIP5_HELAN|nr:U2 small nuclear ribonucleoprotein B''-like isoform X2 [Helianthus annuus]KAF5801756.1 hypothetical protein HanXRQr2_Chr06g0251751 [Helianthus annuus]
MMYMAKKRRDGPQGYNGVRTKNNGARDALYQSEKPDKQETTPPDNILEDDMLALLLKQFSGFKDVKIIYAKLGIAFFVFDEKKNFLLQRNPHRAQDHPSKMSFLQKLKKIVLCVGIKMHNGVCVNVWFNLKREDEVQYFGCSGHYKCHLG